MADRIYVTSPPSYHAYTLEGNFSFMHSKTLFRRYDLMHTLDFKIKGRKILQIIVNSIDFYKPYRSLISSPMLDKKWRRREIRDCRTNDRNVLSIVIKKLKSFLFHCPNNHKFSLRGIHLILLGCRLHNRIVRNALCTVDKQGDIFIEQFDLREMALIAGNRYILSWF